MTRVCIIGWYGTETMGDRAILDGIFKILRNKFKNLIVDLGTLNPFFSERTLLQDRKIYSDGFNSISINLFDEKNKEELYKAIEQSDYVIMGGGPLVDLNELYIIRRAFRYAKKKKKITGLIGCGIGPLHIKRLEKVVREILKLSDIVILRDPHSEKVACSLGCNKAFVLHDPATISVAEFKNSCLSGQREKYIALNFRRITDEYGVSRTDYIQELVQLLKKFEDTDFALKLIPMHTFFIGGDDRDLFAELKGEINSAKVEIVNKPIDIYELYNIYLKAFGCVGMRYHSIVMQTILNGNNVILDYTDPNKGKISGFIKLIHGEEFYRNRYYNLQIGHINEEQIICELNNTDSLNIEIDPAVEISKYCSYF